MDGALFLFARLAVSEARLEERTFCANISADLAYRSGVAAPIDLIKISCRYHLFSISTSRGIFINPPTTDGQRAQDGGDHLKDHRPTSK